MVNAILGSSFGIAHDQFLVLEFVGMISIRLGLSNALSLAISAGGLRLEIVDSVSPETVVSHETLTIHHLDLSFVLVTCIQEILLPDDQLSLVHHAWGYHGSVFRRLLRVGASALLALLIEESRGLSWA